MDSMQMKRLFSTGKLPVYFSGKGFVYKGIWTYVRGKE